MRYVGRELENLDASEICARRLDAKENITPKMVKTSYSRSQTEQYNCLDDARFSENARQHGINPKEAKGDTITDDREAGNAFWSIEENYIYRHHVEPRVELYVLEEESFPTPLRYINVIRRTHTTLDVLQDKPYGR